MKTIIENYCNGIDVDENNIYLDRDGLIVSGTETHKIRGWTLNSKEKLLRQEMEKQLK